MSTQFVKLKRTEFDKYLFIARPCVDISECVILDLINRADKDDLDFIGIVYDNVQLPDGAEYDKKLSLMERPSYIMLVRNIGAGLYRKDFLKKNNIVSEDDEVLFPDIFLLWQTFIKTNAAMLVSASICENVRRDTVWIDDSRAAFTVNRTYDRIKDMLMKDWPTWQRWKSYYSAQRWACYFEILHWMTEETGWEFAERMVVDFHRSYELDEIDEQLFTPEERSTIYMLAKDPGYVKRFYLGKVIMNKKVFDSNNRVRDLERIVTDKDRQLQAQRSEFEKQLEQERANYEEQERQRKIECEQQLQRELEQQKNKYETSTTFRAGKVIMFVPVTIKKILTKVVSKTK